jgi:hypothetical protein
MSTGTNPNRNESQQQTDWWSTRFGDRGVIQLIIGNDVGGILALTAVGTPTFVILVKGNYEVLGSFINLSIFVIVFYFFARFTGVLIRVIEATKAASGRT